jgi:hypothetical protein
MMFEHDKLDGEWHKVIPAMDSFTSEEILEVRETINKERDPKATSRIQYAVVGDRLVERNLPPETVGDKWGYDAWDTPWWASVNNPPHAGLIADFNKSFGGLQKKPLDKDNNVVAFGASGEEVVFKDGTYTVTRAKDSKEMTASSILDLRKEYYAD